MYKLEQIDVYDVQNTASTYIKEQEGKKTTSAISISPTFDTRDDYFNPKKGARHSLFIQNAGGILGGDNYFVKVTGETSWYFPLPLNSTLNLRAKAGLIAPYGGKKLPIYEKFFVGGIQTVRGFEYGRAGPVDETDEPTGAKKMVIFNAEWIFPIAREIGLRGALFFDVGKGFDKFRDQDHLVVDFNNRGILNRRILTRPGKGLFPLKFGAGPGIRWFSPFGPIHIDIGFNLSPKKGEKGNVIEFSAGTVY
jgi:outer membrane protein insertion porin family